MGNLFGITSIIYNQFNWVPENSKFVLPAMNINPDTITASGFSGGSYFASLFHVVNSATIKGVGLKAGGVYSLGFRGAGRDSIPDSWINDAIAKAHELSDKGEIDNISNLNGSPVKIISCLQDESQNPPNQKGQKTFYEAFGANISYEEDDDVHTTNWSDPQRSFQHMYPNIAATGMSSSSDVQTGSQTDKTYQTEGYVYKFDQRLYTTPEEYHRAALAQWGYLYVPKRCADGTNAQCHLSIQFYGCGGNMRIKNRADLSVNQLHQDYGYGQIAYENDIIYVFPNYRDACWNMMWDLSRYTNDNQWLKKDGAQGKAIKYMIDRLKQSKDGSDIANLPNKVDYDFTKTWKSSDQPTFWDNLGAILSLNTIAFIRNLGIYIFI